MNAFGAAGWEPDPEWTRAAEEHRHEEKRRQAAVVAAMEAPDPDYSVVAIDLTFTVGNIPGDPEYPWEAPCSDNHPSNWQVIPVDDAADGEDKNRRLVDALLDEIKASLVPWMNRLAGMGGMRGDGTFACTTAGGVGGEAAATYYLITDAAQGEHQLRDLASWPVVSTSLTTIPDTWLEVRGAARPVNATKLHEALSVEEWPVGEYDGPGTPSRFPLPNEGRDTWLARASIGNATLDAILDRWEAVGRDPLFYDLFGTAAERSAEAGRNTQWLVEGRLPRGQITSLVGNGQTGKSSLAHEIASALGCIEKSTLEPRTVLGQPVDGTYIVAMLTGEDSARTIQFRQDRHATIWGDSRTFQLNGSDKPFGEWLEALCARPRLDLLIIDPVVKFLDGNEDSAQTVSEFYSRLERLARLQDCAVLVIHHLTKGRPRSLAQMLTMVRGSGVHTDRPRLVWGMRDLGNGLVEIGPIKSNFAEEEIGWAVNVGRLYRRDAASFTLRPVVSGGSEQRDTADALQLVLAAIGRLNGEGRICRRSGKHGLFELRAPELIGLARATILTAIGTLVEQGLLTDGEGGLEIARHSVPEASPSFPSVGDAPSDIS